MVSPYPAFDSEPWYDELKAYIDSRAADSAAAIVGVTAQPLDSDLSAIAALTTTSFGRSLLAQANAAAALATLGAQPSDADLTAIAALATTSYGRSFLALADAAAARTLIDAPSVAESKFETLIVALTDELTAITTTGIKVTMRMPYSMNLTAVRASLTATSSSGLPTIQIKHDAVNVLSTPITIDVLEASSTTAATPPVIANPALLDDKVLQFDVTVTGTGAKGLKVYLIGTRV